MQMLQEWLNFVLINVLLVIILLIIVHHADMIITIMEIVLLCALFRIMD